LRGIVIAEGKRETFVIVVWNAREDTH
jgi:hypothetical protein